MQTLEEVPNSNGETIGAQQNTPPGFLCLPCQIPSLVQESKDLEKLKVFPTNLNRGADSSVESRDRVYATNDQALASAVNTGPTSQSMRRPGCEEASHEGQQKQGKDSQGLRSEFGFQLCLSFPTGGQRHSKPRAQGIVTTAL